MEYPSRFNEESRYIFTNWSDEDFTGMWNGISHTVKAGAYIEVPEYKAFHYCRHLVDREMRKAGNEATLGVHSAREAMEKKTIVKIGEEAESPVMETIKKQLKKEMESDKADSKPEFASLKK